LKLRELAETDDATNWRQRRLVADQICRTATLCQGNILRASLCPFVLELAVNDFVASVRESAFRTLAVLAVVAQPGLLRTAAGGGRDLAATTTFDVAFAPGDVPAAAEVGDGASYDDNEALPFCEEIAKRLGQSKKSRDRVGFVKICHHFLQALDASAPASALSTLERHFVRPLCALANDSVPNVRQVVSRFSFRTLIRPDWQRLGRVKTQYRPCSALSHPPSTVASSALLQPPSAVASSERILFFVVGGCGHDTNRLALSRLLSQSLPKLMQLSEDAGEVWINLRVCFCFVFGLRSLPDSTPRLFYIFFVVCGCSQLFE
jgi:hypothetical protein